MPLQCAQSPLIAVQQIYHVCAKITRPLTDGGAYFKVCSGPITVRVGQSGGPRVSQHLATLHPAGNSEPRTRFTFISDVWGGKAEV